MLSINPLVVAISVVRRPISERHILAPWIRPMLLVTEFNANANSGFQSVAPMKC